MTVIDRATISSYATDYNTAGNPEAAATAAREIAKSKGIELTPQDFVALRDALVNFDAANPTEGLRLPGEFRGADGASLSGMESTQVTADIYSCMALFQKLAQQMRDTARQQRSSEMELKFQAQMDAASKMESAAHSRFAASQAEAIGEIVAGSIGVAGSLGSLKFAGESAGAQASNKAVLGVTDGLGKIATGSAKEWASHQRLDADLADKDKTKLEAQATQHDNLVQQANDMMQQMLDVIHDVRDKLQSMEQASVETNKGIARNV